MHINTLSSRFTQSTSLFFFTALIFLLALGCTIDQRNQLPNNLQKSDASDASDAYPSVTTTISPSNPSIGESFLLTISATDDHGLKTLSWKSSKSLLDGKTGSQMGSFSCDLQKTCSHTWELIADEEGTHQLTVTAIDSSEQKVQGAPLEVQVGPYREIIPRSFPPSTASSQNYTSTPSTTPSTVSSSEGTSPPPSNPLPSPEEQPTESCSSNSDCGHKQICRNGNCEDVECTNDAQCIGCRRCSGYECVKCSYGALGVCTC